jgi:hypothetical protein
MNFNSSSAPTAAGLTAAQPVSHGYKVDISRGERVGRVSSEWFSRPDDERYLSLSEMYAAVRSRADRATARTMESRAIRVEASRDDGERLVLIVPGREAPVAPTHWSFGQLCGLVGAPSSYLRDLPAPLAGINLQHGLLSHRAELMKTLEAEDGRVELRAVTGPDYGRARRRGPTTRERLRFRAGHHRARSHQAASGRAAGTRGQGEASFGVRSLTLVKPWSRVFGFAAAGVGGEI